MNLMYMAIGLSFVLAVVVDLLWTTLWVEGGAGPLTSRLMAWIWRLLRQVGSENSRVLTLSGPSILVIGLAVWIGLLWGGWTFIFASVGDSIADTLNRGAISWADWLYFTGYAIFTLGNGDFVPKENSWQIITILATASGMLFITLAITYVISVLDAVTQKRAFATDVSGLGSPSDEILRRSWNSTEFERLDLPLVRLSSELTTLTANHKAYPILHYFYSNRTEEAPTVNIAVLDEALTLLRFGVSERDRPSDTILNNARSSVESYLGTLHREFVDPADRSPPPPDLESLRETGIHTVSDEEFTASLETVDRRRRTLLGLVESDVRQWPSRGDN